MYVCAHTRTRKKHTRTHIRFKRKKISGHSLGVGYRLASQHKDLPIGVKRDLFSGKRDLYLHTYGVGHRLVSQHKDLPIAVFFSGFV